MSRLYLQAHVKTMAMAEVDCYSPTCKRTFIASTYEVAYRLMKEHFEQDHPEMVPGSKVYWTRADLDFLKGCLISPD